LGTLEGRPLVTPKLRWEDYVKHIFQKRGYETEKWIKLASCIVKFWLVITRYGTQVNRPWTAVRFAGSLPIG
jgi:hypothetical protein